MKILTGFCLQNSLYGDEGEERSDEHSIKEIH